MTDTEQETARENAALMEQLLTEPQSSALMHWFIMVAVEEYCDKVLTTREGGLQNPLIDEKVWRACALEAKEAMERWKV
jgi:hypothetical protein